MSVPEDRLIAVLAHSLAWLNNLARDIGEEKVLDACPDNWEGRSEIEAVLFELRAHMGDRLVGALEG
jgi:hypothetical protein